MSCKYIFVTGGVISGTGKGISAASIGLLLKLRGHKVNFIKFDPYFNNNAGTMSPGEHGECFLCEDGTEADLDLGHYERMAGCTVSRKNIATSGSIFKDLNREEEAGKFLGQTIQIVPHVTNKVQDKLIELGETAEIVVAEIGGCVGDIESEHFYESIRQFKLKRHNDVMVVMVAPILWVPTIKEFKTKPLQRSIKDLNVHGISADMLLCRIDRPVDEAILDKVANMTSVPRDCIFFAPDVSTIYQVPIEFYNREIDNLIVDKFSLKRNSCRIGKYKELVEQAIESEKEGYPQVTIGVFGKYSNCHEAYISLKEALMHAGVANEVKVNVRWINSEALEGEKSIKEFFKDLHGIIVPGGFGDRGVEGKIRAIEYVRKNNIPFLGICLGLQCAVVEFARNVCKLAEANSAEWVEGCINPVIHFVDGQESIKNKSGTMRLGAYECTLKKDSLAHKLYKKKNISERHRHRYEVNEEYVERIQAKEFLVSGRHPDTNLVEIMELAGHPFFIGTQAHPEFRSRLGDPAPLFDGLVKAALHRIEIE